MKKKTLKKQTLFEKASEFIDSFFDDKETTNDDKEAMKNHFRIILNKNGTEINWPLYLEGKNKMYIKSHMESLKMKGGNDKGVFFFWEQILLVACGIISRKLNNVYLVSNSYNLFLNNYEDTEGEYLLKDMYFISKKDAKRFAKAANKYFENILIFKVNRIKGE
ncbi:MAG: hypothetical protein WC788_00160 [Candidatus Paceibacterota bacterium]|jgi:hypothetical protein